MRPVNGVRQSLESGLGQHQGERLHARFKYRRAQHGTRCGIVAGGGQGCEVGCFEVRFGCGEEPDLGAEPVAGFEGTGGDGDVQTAEGQALSDQAGECGARIGDNRTHEKEFLESDAVIGRMRVEARGMLGELSRRGAPDRFAGEE